MFQAVFNGLAITTLRFISLLTLLHKTSGIASALASFQLSNSQIAKKKRDYMTMVTTAMLT
jgi:hypothetical protein